MNDTDNNKDIDEAWAVEPPKRTGRRALRIALISAAVGAAAVAVGAAVLLGKKIKVVFEEAFRYREAGIVVTVPTSDSEEAIDHGQTIRGDEF